MANTKVTSRVLADDAVNISNINTVDGNGGASSPSADGQALVAKADTVGYYLDWATISGTTINNNADNRVITGSGTANTLNGESNLVFDGTNLGVGTSSPVAPVTINDKATFSFNVNDAVYGNNLYYDGAGNDRWERLSGNAGGAYYQTAGAHIWYRTAAGGATGDAVTPTESMRITNAGNVGIGTSTPNSYSNVTTLTINGTVQGRLDVEYGGTHGGSFLAVSGETQVKAVGASNVMTFEVNNAERMRIDTDGCLLINKTAKTVSSSKFEVDSNARIGNIFLQGDSSNSKLIAGNAEVRLSSLEFRGGGSGLDFDVTLIKTGVGFTNMFKVDSPSGDTFTNDGTISSLSDERIKTDINDLTDGLDIVKQLRPVTFKYNDTTEDEEGKKELGTADDTVRYGFIAQEVEAVAPQYVETSTRKINNEEVDDFKSLSTTRMIPMLFKAIQEQQTIIDDLKSRIETLEG